MGFPAFDVPRHLIIRPRRRMVRAQLTAGMGCFCVIAIFAFALGERRFLGFLGCGFAVVVAAQLAWFHLRAPRAIVATEEFLAITERGGSRRKIPWASVSRADHSTELTGMQWELSLLGGGQMILRDIGIHANRWGILRAVTIESAGRNGAAVRVDPLSELTYGGG